MNAEPRPTHGLAPKGKKAKVKSKKAKRYQARLDIWGAVSYNKPLAIDIQTSENRKKKGVRGYGKKDTKLFLRKKIAPQLAKMNQNVIVGMDRGFHFTPDEIENELKAREEKISKMFGFFHLMQASYVIPWTITFGT